MQTPRIVADFQDLLRCSTLVLSPFLTILETNMFNTLGNIYVNSKVGLIFVDFDKGSTLQLTGRAKILWEEDIVSTFLGAQRVILFHLDQVVESSTRNSIHFEFIDYSPYNPALSAAVPSCKSEQLVPPLSDEIVRKMLEKFSS